MNTTKNALFICLLLLALVIQPAVYGQKIPPKKLKQLRPQRFESMPQEALQAGRAHTSKAAEHSRARHMGARPDSPFSAAVRFSKTDIQKMQASLARQSLHSGLRSQNFFLQRQLSDISQTLLARYTHPLDALHALWQTEPPDADLQPFAVFATALYRRHFISYTPHLWDFFVQAARLKSHALEEKIIKRIHFLGTHRQLFRERLAPHVPQMGLRLRYTKDIALLSPNTFQPEDLVLSFEQQMRPGQPHTLITHIRGNSAFAVQGRSYPVYHYDGPPQYLAQLYLYLINGENAASPVTAVWDPETRSLAMYNHDKTRWLRITPHEYANPRNLHIHLNETRTLQMALPNGKPFQERVNFNLFIPLGHPATLRNKNHEDYMYRMMVTTPLALLKKAPHVTFLTQSIF